MRRRLFRILRNVEIILGISAAFTAAYFGLEWLVTKDLSLPDYQKVDVHWTDQHWKPEDWNWFYHVSQGGSLDLPLPYSWFMALEQPSISYKRQPLLSNSTYLARMGFLPDEKRADNPDGLPVGFARNPHFHDPVTGETSDVIGLTCAACHTGQLNYHGQGIRIEGGSALVNLDKLRKAIGASLLTTYYHPFRFNRFAERILGHNASSQKRDELRRELGWLITKGNEAKKRDDRLHLNPIEEGFGRLDALDRIGNFVFGTELDKANLTPITAPVSFPHIWDAPWFEWVQYNGSIKQPMTRNAGEAMGVFARVNFGDDPKTRFNSTVNTQHLSEIEHRLRGPNIFQTGTEPQFHGLTAPKWPENILGKINQTKAQRGHKLYAQYCQSCHLPPANSREFFDDHYWTAPDNQGRRYLKVKMINVAEIGTDATTATNWYKSVVNLGPLANVLNTDINKRLEPFLGTNTGGGSVPAAVALPIVVEKTVEKQYMLSGIPSDQWDDMNGNRPNDVRAPLAYMARPLNGIWATPPYLHNGSVPNIYQLLSPPDERDQTFWLGNREYDPVLLGYKTDMIEGGFIMDTAIPGNRNTGHAFSAPKDEWPKILASKQFTPGIIGPELTPEERMDIIEFLKTF